jgi:HEAT repeat protein
VSTLYVSSTFTDLRAHRKALSLAIRRLGHVDTAMEYYVAEEARPLDRCVRDAGACDLYVGLFARRYGFCPPGEQRSITELELRAARAANIDCLCFLLADDALWPDEHVEHGVGADKLAALRAEISERYLCGFFTTPDELAALASAAIVRNLELGRAPFDAQREHRLIKIWRANNTLPAQRVRAAQALVHMGSPRYVAAIKERLLDASAQHNVASIASYLAELQRLAASRRELMPIFLDLLEHEDANRRSFAVFQLGELALRGAALAPETIDALLARACDAVADVRAELAHTLGKLTPRDRAHPGVLDTLLRLADDDSPEVRQRAAEALRGSGEAP